MDPNQPARPLNTAAAERRKKIDRKPHGSVDSRWPVLSRQLLLLCVASLPLLWACWADVSVLYGDSWREQTEERSRQSTTRLRMDSEDRFGSLQNSSTETDSQRSGRWSGSNRQFDAANAVFQPARGDRRQVDLAAGFRNSLGRRSVSSGLGAIQLAQSERTAQRGNTSYSPPPRIIQAGAIQPVSDRGNVLLSFNFSAAPWDQVIKRFAQEADLAIQMEVVPPGTLTYIDSAKYTPTEALDILNGYLLQIGYILLRRDRSLLVAELDSKNPIPPRLIPRVPVEKLHERGRNELLTVVLKVENITASEAADDVMQLLGPLGRVVALNNSNRIVVTDLGTNVRRIHNLLGPIPGESSRKKTVVFKLKNTPAVEIAQAINNYLASRTQSTSGLSTAPRTANQSRTTSPRLSRGLNANRHEATVVAVEYTNSVIVSAKREDLEDIERLIRELDKAPKQVYIQALFVEVELGNTDEFGVELGLQDSVLFNRSVLSNIVTLTQTVTNQNIQTTNETIISQESQPGFNFNNQPLGNNTAISPGSLGSQGLTNFGVGRVNGDLGFGGLVFSASNESISILLRALRAEFKVHVLSAPRIRTIDNHEALMQIGQEVPITRGVQVNAVGSANPIIEQDEAGLILRVTPHIGDDGRVVIDVNAEKSRFNLAPGTGVPIFIDVASGNVIEAPIKDITVAQTTVAMKSGETVVLGGMITKEITDVKRQVPFLGDIPWIGELFKYKFEQTRRKELLIFLTPQVIENDADEERIKLEEVGRMHFPIEEAAMIHGPIFDTPIFDNPDPIDYQQYDDAYDEAPETTSLPARASAGSAQAGFFGKRKKSGRVQYAGYEQPAAGSGVATGDAHDHSRRFCSSEKCRTGKRLCLKHRAKAIGGAWRKVLRLPKKR